jgi:2-polyprenyl-6-methoxyphenol hydroxylase-like FAD-dependent oxidoreductase
MEAVNYPDTPSRVFYDVVIIGGGPAGCAVAVQLLRRGCTVAIIDKGSNSRFSIGETLVPEVSGVLQTVGLQNALIDSRRLPARGVISSWGSSDPEVRDFLFSPHGNG